MCRGPLFGQLTRGQPVTTPDGIVVTPAECMEDTYPGEVVIVVDCPSAAHLPGLSASSGPVQALVGSESTPRVLSLIHI